MKRRKTISKYSKLNDRQETKPVVGAVGNAGSTAKDILLKAASLGIMTESMLSDNVCANNLNQEDDISGQI